MKTLEALYKDIVGNEELKKEFLEAVKNQDIDGFMAKHDCPATKEEIAQFLKDMQEGALSDEELDAVSGGGNYSTNVLLTVVTVGTGCVGDNKGGGGRNRLK